MSEVACASRKREMVTVDRIDRAGHGDRPSDVVEMAAEPADEVAAMAAVRKVLLSLALLLRIGKPAAYAFSTGSRSRTTPRRSTQAQLLGELVDAAGDLLAVRARREPLDQAADLAGSSPQP